MRKPVLIVIAGPNGSGKTSTTRLVIRHEWAEQCVYINPDEIAQTKFGDWNNPEAVRQAVEYCEEWREQLLFRTTNGQFAKQYVAELPVWTEKICNNIK